jgi:DNA repair exonuclease SbcCD ATPase subunit
LNVASEVGIPISDDANVIPSSFNLSSDLYFIERILSRLGNLGKNYSSISSDNRLVATIKKDILEKDLGIGSLAEKLRTYSPIEDIRINPNFNIYINRNTEVASIKNLFLDFKINGSWLPFSDLSDGTKRIFIIISELSWSWSTFTLINQKKYKPVKLQLFFIEEPELGIHPHQLYDLMRFIKEQSSNKQIIITTHSPDVLDIIDKENLDRIIIANYELDKGTQLRHLTDNEKKKATTFLENEAFLSDYWKHSTLETR